MLASKKDKVLQLAYPAGDFLSDILFRDDDSPVRKALGYHGPHPLAERVLHAQISDAERYDHGDYLPPSNLATPVGKQARPETFVAETLRGAPHAWP